MLVGDKWDKMHDIAKRVYSADGLSPKILEEPIAYDEQNGYLRKDGTVGSLTTDGSSPKYNNRIVEPTSPIDQQYRVRKLTERECFKLMGVKQEDFEKIRKNQSKSSCYHLAGDSICCSVLMAIFGQMFDIDWKEKINETVEEIIKGI